MKEPVQVKQVIVIRVKYPDNKNGTRSLRAGKMIAQGSHASMAWIGTRFRAAISILLENFSLEGLAKKLSGNNREIFKIGLSHEEILWFFGGFTKVVLQVDTEEELLEIFEKAKTAGLTVELITDSGKTEFDGVPTKTCLGIGPNKSEEIDAITGALKLY